jgi:Glutaredoxin-related protein
MKRITLYGYHHCPDCLPIVQFLNRNFIDYTYIDVLDSMPNLRKFMKYRDHHEAFAEVRELDLVGIPAIVVNDGEKIFLTQPDPSELL